MMDPLPMRRRALLTMPLLATPALAQAPWPNRPIRAVIPYTPGGATDAMSRLAAQKLSERLGVSVVPENRAGGSGTVGGMAVAGAAPDGYTILLTASVHVMGRQVLKSVPYDPVADFTPIARNGQGPLLLVTNPGRREADIAAVVEAARREPPCRWPAAGRQRRWRSRGARGAPSRRRSRPRRRRGCRGWNSSPGMAFGDQRGCRRRSSGG
jgi:tripartite-type tricarboxylate transporter receptor subunit TctC